MSFVVFCVFAEVEVPDLLLPDTWEIESVVVVVDIVVSFDESNVTSVVKPVFEDWSVICGGKEDMRGVEKEESDMVDSADGDASVVVKWSDIVDSVDGDASVVDVSVEYEVDVDAVVSRWAVDDCVKSVVVSSSVDCSVVEESTCVVDDNTVPVWSVKNECNK